MSLLEFTFLAASSLFVIIDPLATAPAFLAMTPGDTRAAREKMARLACLVAAGVLVLFALGGKAIFKFFGVTLPAFQIAGSLVLLMIALDMLRAQRSSVKETAEEAGAAAAKEDIAITPLAFPMLAGPGAISSCILLRAQAKTFAQETALIICILVVCLATYLILRFAAYTSRWMNPLVTKLVTRLMGLLLVAVAVQFFLDGLRAQKGILF